MDLHGAGRQREEGKMRSGGGEGVCRVMVSFEKKSKMLHEIVAKYQQKKGKRKKNSVKKKKKCIR